MEFIPVMAKMNFQHHYSNLDMILKIILIWWFGAQETFLLIINVKKKNGCVA